MFNNSSVLFESCLNFPDSVPIIINCQLLQTINLLLSLTREENVITTVELSSYVLLSNFWQLLQTIDLLLFLSREENVITAAELSSYILLSNFWQTKKIPLFLYSSKENIITIAEFSNNILSPNIEQINRLRNNFTFLSEILFVATEQLEKIDKNQTI